MNTQATELRPRVQVTWDDGFPPTDWVDPIPTAPSGGRWVKNLAHFRPGFAGNVSATVRVTLGRPGAVWAEVWFGRDYAKAGGYGFKLDAGCP